MSSQPKTELKLVTPAMAQAWLAKNTDNRPVRRDRVAALASRIRNGEWEATHQGICIATSGRLLDGQHRLLAIVLTGIPVTVNVSTGFSEKTFDVIDNQLSRSVADRARLDRRLVQVLRLAMEYCYGGSYDRDSAANNLRMANIGLKDAHEVLVDKTTNAGVYACAPMRLVLSVMIMDGGNAFNIHGLYQNLTRKRFAGLPKIAGEFVRQVETSGKGWPVDDPRGLMARAIKVFDPSKANCARLSVNDRDREAAVRYVVDFIKPRYERQVGATGKAAAGRSS